MKRIVALFDDRAEASRVEQDLVKLGIPPGSIRLSDQTAAGEQRTFWDNLRDFFGAGDTDIYEEAARRGGTLLVADVPESRADEFIAIVSRHNPIDIEHRAGEWQRSGWQPRAQARATSQPETATAAAGQASTAQPARASTTAEQVIPVVQEQLKVGKRRETHGGVRVYSQVEEVPVQEQVQLRDEKVHVERRKVDRPAGPGAFQEKTIQATETHEEPVVRKEARVVEEVVLGKDVNQRTETVKDTVRKTNVQVDELDDDFRKDYEQSFAKTGYSYDQVRPAYDYGRQLAADERYRDRDWPMIETEARQDFERRNPGQWTAFSPAVRHGYDRARLRARGR